ncbi:MAG: YggS family pyridoxal phosphate-dependent enzyme [Pirellulales bacterium]
MSHSSDSVRDRLRRNVDQVRFGISAACESAGRSVDTVKLIGVTKYVDAAATGALAGLGCIDLGESRPQLLWQKYDALADRASSGQWHMIGHLQRNKVARTAACICWLHSLDSLRLAETLEKSLAEIGKTLNVLLEVNVTRDAEKTGLAAEAAAELMASVIGMPHLKLRGLMAMSTDGADESLARQEFADVRSLRDSLQTQFGSAVDLTELSMGMSGDYAWAIAEGSTMVRIGSSLWEGLM